MLHALADATSPTLTPWSAGTSAVVALLALGLALLAFRAWRKRRNAGLAWVGGAFVVFAVKNVFSAYNVTEHAVPHDEIELILSLFDLLIMLMLFAPFLGRRRS